MRPVVQNSMISDQLKRYPQQIGVGGLSISDYEKQLVNEVLNSNRLTYGAYTKEFERLFAKAHNVRHAAFVNSGTSALHIAIAALKERHGWADGDEVLVPAVTFVATSNIVLHNNLKPVFVEVESRTYNIDPSRIEECITPHTRAIIPVHLLGLPADMEPLMEIARKYNLKVVEDSCETMFARYKGAPVGSIGDIGCFSTYVAHVLVTGVGGLAVTNDSELAVDLRSLMNHGRDSIYIACDDDQNKAGAELETIVANRFKFIHYGHSFRCTEIEAALGIGQLAKVDSMMKRRREIAAKMISALSQFEDRIQLPHVPADREHCYMLFGLALRNERKEGLVNFLEARNIETRDLLPLINQPVYKRHFGDLESKFPVAKWINESAFYIGCHGYMTDDEVDFVIEAFGDYFSTH
jgi:dTDP-4-amino-4,6-dideoxygalactose transaminase